MQLSIAAESGSISTVHGTFVQSDKPFERSLISLPVFAGLIDFFQRSKYGEETYSLDPDLFE